MYREMHLCIECFTPIEIKTFDQYRFHSLVLVCIIDIATMATVRSSNV